MCPRLQHREMIWYLIDKLVVIYGETLVDKIKPTWKSSRQHCEMFRCENEKKKLALAELDKRIMDIIDGMTLAKGKVRFLHSHDGMSGASKQGKRFIGMTIGDYDILESCIKDAGCACFIS